MNVDYLPLEIENKHYMIQIIEVEKEIIIVIQYKHQNVINSLTLSQKTIETIPSTTTIYGDIFDTESQSLSQLFSMKFNKKVMVSCNVEFSLLDNTKNIICSSIIKFINEKHNKSNSTDSK